MGKVPWLIVLAGPNGAGKTTFANRLLPRLFAALPFINVDDLRREVIPATPTPDFAAGREAVRRMEALIAERRGFVIETTLSGREHLNRLRRLKQDGWRIVLIYLGLRAVENSLRRVAYRVRAGGHGVPDDVIRRRFSRSLEHLTAAVPLVDVAVVIDNSERVPKIVAVSRDGAVEIVDAGRSPALTSSLATLVQPVPDD